MEAILFTEQNRDAIMHHPEVNYDHGALLDKAYLDGFGRTDTPITKQFYFIPQYDEVRVEGRRNWALLPVDFVRISYRFDESRAKTEFVQLERK